MSMQRHNIIGIMGKLKSGKDTVGQMLLETQPGARVAFADKLKEICGEMYGLTKEQMNTEEGKAKDTQFQCFACPLCKGINCEEVKLEREYKIACLNPKCNAVGEKASFKGFWTPRMILQHVGTEGMRHVDPNVWVNYAMRKSKQILAGDYVGATSDTKPPRFVVITDCRFRSEMAGIIAAGGEVWRLRRPETDQTSSGLAQHASEVEMDGIPDSEFNRVIVNDTNLAELRTKTSAALSQFFSARS
jgi:hypothetical protein